MVSEKSPDVRASRGRSPTQPNQKSQNLMPVSKSIDNGRLFMRAKHNQEITQFDSETKNQLFDKFQQHQSVDNRPTQDDKIQGVKVLPHRMKNDESGDGFHIVSNLTLDQVANQISYDGKTKQADHMQAMGLDTIQLSERRKHKTQQ